jgi:hypothetical protein
MRAPNWSRPLPGPIMIADFLLRTQGIELNHSVSIDRGGLTEGGKS